MRQVVASMLAVTGLASAARAQVVNTRLAFEVSRDGVSWTSSLSASPGDTIQVRALLTYIGSASAPTAGGIGQCVFQPVITGWTADTYMLTNERMGLTGQWYPAQGIGPVGGTRSTPVGTVPDLPGVFGRITPFGSNATTTSTYLRGHLGTGTAAGMMRMARADITNWIGVGPTSGPGAANNWNGGGGVSIAQIANPSRIATDPPFNSGTSNVVAFKFGYVIGAEAAGSEMVVTVPEDALNGPVLPPPQFQQPRWRWFASTDQVSASLLGRAELAEAFVTVVPGPGVLGFFGVLGGALAWRRRREPRSVRREMPANGRIAMGRVDKKPEGLI